MLRSLRMYPLLEGYRGAPACDIGAVKDVLLRLSALVDTHPEVIELDANPVIVDGDGATIVDARIRVQATLPPTQLSALRG
jgi:acyl-CoA synthetase (NDP forming)